MTYWFLKIVLPPFLRTFWGLRCEGLDRVPRRGGAILACNHLSASDWIFGPAVVRRKITYVAKAEYFDSWRTRWFFRSAGQIPIDRDGGTAAEGALLAAKSVLARGKLFGIFPEGTRSPDGRLHKGKSGAARLALETGVPLIPMAVIGSEKVLPQGSKLPRRCKVTVSFGEPIDTTVYRSWSDRGAALRAITDELMAAIQELSGQEYRDEYAADVKVGARRAKIAAA